MARIRTIKPELPQSESMGKISRDARLCFILMWTLADDEGRLRGNSRMLASLLFPYDDDAPGLIEGWVAELIDEQCILVYQAEGSTYIQIAKWLNHQKIDKPSKSKIPEFVESSPILANVRGGIKDQGSKDQGSKEGKGTSCAEPQSDSPLEVAPLQPEPVAVLAMPLVGSKEFGITQTQIDEWVTAYPGIDVIRQLAAMRQWLLANPTRRKTSRGILGFCNSWLMRAQDKAPAARAGPGAARPAGSVYDQTMAAAERAKQKIFGVAAARQGEMHDAG